MEIVNSVGIVAFGIEKKLRRKLGRTKNLAQIVKREIVSDIKGNYFLGEMLKESIPFMVARFGSTEMQLINRYYLRKYGIVRSYKQENINGICKYSGFFPKGDVALLDRFAEAMISSAYDLDMLGLLNSYDEGWLIKKEVPDKCKITYLKGLEPYYHEKPWSKLLEGKRVLVVHPFAETIKEQFGKREFLFKNKDVLPEFELEIVKAVQSLAGEQTGFSTWFEALDYMTNQIEKRSFDVALLGCGAYGFPLASRIKNMGKQAIHMGGALQILFGIRGGRWDSHPIISKLYNENWVRPKLTERPQNFNQVENGCYW